MLLVCQVAVIVSMVVMCIIALLFIPIFGLTGFHIVLGKRFRPTRLNYGYVAMARY